MGLVKTIQEFLEARDFDPGNPYYWARCLYKYTDCGPWVVFVTKTQEVYYSDINAASLKDVLENCTGIKVGSIVEGSDVYVGPVEFMFPFEMDDFDKGVGRINEEANFYWDRDNSRWFYIVPIEDSTAEYYANLRETWGEFAWDSDVEIPADIKNKVEEFISDWDDCEKKKEFAGFEITEYVNDSIF